MVLKLTPVSSSCSSSPLSTDSEYRSYMPSSNSLCVSPIMSPGTEFSIKNRCWLQPLPFRFNGFSLESGADLDNEDDDFSEGSSVSSDGASSFDSRSVCSVANEMDTLNERRREMLRLSISKIQTMNASNVFVSLRKSLLIFNTMKSLQRELDECDRDAYCSLIEGNDEASCEDTLFEEGDNDAGSWDFERDIPCFRDQVLGSRPNYDESEIPVQFQNSVQDLDLFKHTFPVVERGATFTGSPFWQSNGSSFIDDYLGALDIWENGDYNPLNNCNLSESEILHMFSSCLERANTQVLTLA